MPESGRMSKINFTNKAKMNYRKCLYRRVTSNGCFCVGKRKMECTFQDGKYCRADEMMKDLGK